MPAQPCHVTALLFSARAWPFDRRHGCGQSLRSGAALLCALVPPSTLETLVGVAGLGEGRAGNSWISLAGQVQVDQTVEVIEYFGIAQHRGAPVGINASLQLSMRLGDLGLQLMESGWVQRRLAAVLDIDGVEGQGRQVGGVGDAAGGAQALKQLENVSTGMGDDPVSAVELAVSRGRAGALRT